MVVEGNNDEIAPAVQEALKDFIQEALAGTVAGFVKSLKFTENVQEIELRIKLNDSRENHEQET